MSNYIDIITNGLEYYDKNNEKFERIKSKMKYYKLSISKSDLDHSKITFFDKHKKKLFTSRYEIIGTYNKFTSTWIWAWSNPSFYKNTTYISKKILNYGIDIPPKHNDLLKMELITSRFQISNRIQIDLHVSLASYLSKNEFVFDIGYKDSYIADFTEIKRFDESKDKEDFVAMYLFLLDTDNIK